MVKVVGIDVFENYAKEQIDKRSKKFLDKVFKNRTINISINSRNLTVGLTDEIKLIEHENLDATQTAYLLDKLKEVNYGDFNKVFGE